MKCDKCGEAEAVFHYRANINGRGSERHLCVKCALEDGFSETMFQGAVRPELFGFEGIFRRSPYGAFPAYSEPGIYGVPQTPEEPEESEGLIPGDAGEEFRQKREIAILRAEMQSAVTAEDFEKAAVLRDKIRELENVIVKE